MDLPYHDTIPHWGDGTPLLAYLRYCWPFLPEHCWQNLLTQGDISLDAQPITIQAECDINLAGVYNPILRQNQSLQYVIRDYQEDEVDTRWQLLWQNDELFAVHKPALLPVSRTTRNVYNTLVQLVRRESDWPDAHLLHRLDGETSGIILFAKTNTASRHWQPKLKTLMLKKRYWAVVHGIPDWQTTQLSCKLATDDNSEIRCKMHVVTEQQPGKQSETHFTLLASGNQSALIACDLITGRKHQIRAHLAHLGHPIIGDKIYAHDGQYFLKRIAEQLTPADEELIKTAHHLLFAQQVTLQIDEQQITITNPNVPEAMRMFCAQNDIAIDE